MVIEGLTAHGAAPHSSIGQLSPAAEYVSTLYARTALD